MTNLRLEKGARVIHKTKRELARKLNLRVKLTSSIFEIYPKKAQKHSF